MIGYCTDSNAQLHDEDVERLGVEVVPLSVTVDGRDHLEGVDLDADGFYACFEGATPVASTGAPGPGRFAAAYERLAEAGSSAILSVHIGSALSATCNAARLAARAAPVPVHLVDTGTASYGTAFCLLAAAAAVEDGADAEEAAAVAAAVGPRTGSVFVPGALDVARRGGRVDAGSEDDDGGGVPVLALVDGAYRAVARARTFQEALDEVVAHVRSAGHDLRAAVGRPERASETMWRELEARLAAAPEVAEVTWYRIGPSSAVHSGPGTASVIFHPLG